MRAVELYRKRPLVFRKPLTNGSLFNMFSDELDVFFNTSTTSKSDTDFTPRANVEETKNSYVLSFDLPGVKKQDVKIDVQGRTITVSGERKHEGETESGGFKRYECLSGSFQRSFNLPEGLDPDRVEATLNDGVLKVVLPKAAAEQPRKIEIKTQ